jgi:hypothetical protein
MVGTIDERWRMEILRLRVWTLRTAQSDGGQPGDEYSYTLPMWQKHVALDLETIDDFVNYAVVDQPHESGDLVLNAFIESTDVPDDTDLSETNPAMAPYFADESDSVNWEPAQNILITIVEWLMEEHQIVFDGDLNATAVALKNAAASTGIFGWSNLDDADPIEVIEMVVALIFEATDTD